MKKTITNILLIICVLSFVACSSMKPKNNSQQTPTSNTSVQTSGLGNGTSFTDNNGLPANKMCAPCEQVYYFGFDKDSIQQQYLAAINLQAKYLLNHPNAKIRLAGNTDERGSREYNIDLGWRRAKAVASILEQQGVSSKQIDLMSYGEEKPVAFGHKEAAYKLNRRVNLTYEAK